MQCSPPIPAFTAARISNENASVLASTTRPEVVPTTMLLSFLLTATARMASRVLAACFEVGESKEEVIRGDRWCLLVLDNKQFHAVRVAYLPIGLG